MWVCKECGESCFSELYKVYKEGVEYNQEGEVIEFGDLEENEFEVMCEECGNRSVEGNIKDIANWEE